MRADLTYFPHICAAIVASVPPSTLPTLRQVSPLFADLVDKRLLEHVAYGVREGRLVSALLPDEPLPVVRAEHIQILDLAMSLRFAGARPRMDLLTSIMGAALDSRVIEDVAGLTVSDEVWAGNAKAPWVLADPPTVDGQPADEVQLRDALPHFPNLRALRCLNYQPVVFPHMMRYTPVPVVVYPADRAISWSPSRRAGGRIVGGGVRAPRAVIAFKSPPEGDFSFYFRANQHERLDIVFVGDWAHLADGLVSDPPPEVGPPGYTSSGAPLAPQAPPQAPPELPRYTSEAVVHTGNGLAPVIVLPEVGPRNPLRGPPLVDHVTSGTFWTCLTDEIAHHVENGGRCTIVGLEAWDEVTRGSAPGWNGSWAHNMARDVAVDEVAAELMREDGLEGGTEGRENLCFATLEDWRAEEENAHVWELIA